MELGQQRGFGLLDPGGKAFFGCGNLIRDPLLIIIGQHGSIVLV